MDKQIEFEKIISGFREQGIKSWSGKEGQQRADKIEQVVRRVCGEYADILGFSPLEILKSIEKNRTYSAVNYYQDSNFPSLKNVYLFKNEKELKGAFPSKKFRCPHCKGISANPYECDSGKTIKETGKKCDWKSYGLFGCLGEGFSFTLTENFLDHGRIKTIFMPLEFEAQQMMKEIEE